MERQEAMTGVESAAFGIGQDTFDMLPKAGIMISCDLIWPFCGF